MAEIIKSWRTSYLHIDGFLFYKHSHNKTVRYWRCKRQSQCSARAITDCDGATLSIRRHSLEDHSHAPNREEVEALRLVTGIKRKAAEHPEAPPVQIMRSLQNVPSSVLGELPDRENIRKCIQRERLKNMPPNPQNIQDLHEIPTQFRKTIVGETFLLYYSYENENYTLRCGRILIFSTSENLRALFRSRIWFVDGTFKTAPTIFFSIIRYYGLRCSSHSRSWANISSPLCLLTFGK